MKRRIKDHQEYIELARKKDFYIPDRLHIELPQEDIKWLKEIGFLLDALTSGRTQPDPRRGLQRKLLAVTRGEAEPKTHHEKIWMKYLEAREAEGDKSPGPLRVKRFLPEMPIDSNDNWDPSAIK